MLLADQSVEEIVATRFDLVFVYRSNGTVEKPRSSPARPQRPPPLGRDDNLRKSSLAYRILRVTTRVPTGRTPDSFIGPKGDGLGSAQVIVTTVLKCPRGGAGGRAQADGVGRDLVA